MIHLSCKIIDVADLTYIGISIPSDYNSEGISSSEKSFTELTDTATYILKSFLLLLDAFLSPKLHS